jgi:hypothetical protein
MVILEKFRKKSIKFGLITTKKILVTTFDCRLKGEMGTVLHLNRTGPHIH